MFDGGLFEIFQHEFGMPGARRFEAARRNFLESTAAYSVVRGCGRLDGFGWVDGSMDGRLRTWACVRRVGVYVCA